MAPKTAEEAEAEIRRTVTRHYAQLTEIEALKTDIDKWRVRATQAEGEVEKLTSVLAAAEEELAKLREAVTTLKTQFETGAQIWLAAYDRMRALKLPIAELEISQQSFYQAIEHKSEESK